MKGNCLLFAICYCCSFRVHNLSHMRVANPLEIEREKAKNKSRAVAKMKEIMA